MKRTVTEGFIGTVSPILGVVTSFQEQLEWWVRFASLLVGLAVGLFTLVSIVRKSENRPIVFFIVGCSIILLWTLISQVYSKQEQPYAPLERIRWENNVDSRLARLEGRR